MDYAVTSVTELDTVIAVAQRLFVLRVRAGLDDDRNLGVVLRQFSLTGVAAFIKVEVHATSNVNKMPTLCDGCCRTTYLERIHRRRA